ncbi:MAG: GAF domain-containing protein [Candidatus Devosia phytovorans]|uniref:GAF domain-containing protein n=1 Tax=Candidatus Devosia phytovorans TaxID=3121372 RepID=A0AAJ5VVS5_9HYPH|nr:GAF domain-containing protein [Devosia sp.]WEK05816.1 MAG: GAF domain-containing protein [Devosia sp.]
MPILDPAFADRLSIALAAGRQEFITLLTAQFLALPGLRTATWLAILPDRSRTDRIGTSDPKVFPIGGFDIIRDDDPWCMRILGEKRPVVCNSPTEMFDFLPGEAQVLIDMGFTCNLSAPMIIDGETRGTVNILGDAGALTPETLAEVSRLLTIAALVFTFRDRKAA